jgi:NAD(P)-dependent dehydrogenase (short-subunit alcohol dehydrogenase family)
MRSAAIEKTASVISDRFAEYANPRARENEEREEEEERSMTDLTQQVALVTGASRGVGRGVALALANAGATVFGTGRSIREAGLRSEIGTIACDHTDDRAVAGVFQYIDERAARLDILVNVAWGGYERMVENGRFTWSAPFWEQPMWRWEARWLARGGRCR